MKLAFHLDYFAGQHAGVIRFKEGADASVSVVERDAQGRIEKTISTPARRREGVALIQNVATFRQFRAAADELARKLREDDTLAEKFLQQLRDEK